MKPTAARRLPVRTPTVMAPLLPLPDDDDVEDGAEAAGELLPLEPEVLLPLPLLEALAAAWNASKVMFAVGLTAKTMPCWQ